MGMYQGSLQFQLNQAEVEVERQPVITYRGLVLTKWDLEHLQKRDEEVMD